jgi:hypothetical protein
MVVVGMRYDHVVNDHVAAVVLLDVLDHLLADLSVAAIDDVQPLSIRVPVLDHDRVAVTASNRQELNGNAPWRANPPILWFSYPTPFIWGRELVLQPRIHLWSGRHLREALANGRRITARWAKRSPGCAYACYFGSRRRFGLAEGP